MAFASLLDASLAIRVHALAAAAALVLGIVQLLAPKGTLPHRSLGWIWAGLMATVALSSLLIHGEGALDNWIGPFGPIHGISAYVLIVLPLALIRAHRGDVARHQDAMRGLFFGGLVVAFLLTLLPGRIMHAVAFGPGP